MKNLYPQLTTRQHEIFIGSMLGDGCLSRQPVNWNWLIQQSFADHKNFPKESYMQFFLDELGGWSRCAKIVMKSHRAKIIDGKIGRVQCEPYPTWRYESCNHLIWTEMGKKWYAPQLVNGRIRKVIPNDLKLTPLSMAIWYMDDGVNQARDAQAKLCTNGFTEEEVVFLAEVMKRDLSIKAVKSRVKKDRSQFLLRVNREAYFEFIDIIRPEIKWDCFGYKTDTSGYVKKDNKGANHGKSKLNDEKSQEIFRLRQIGRSRKEVAAIFGVTEACVTRIASGQGWKHLGNPMVRQHKKMTAEDRTQALRLLAEGKDQEEVASIIGTSQSSISRLLNKKTFAK
jgi:predicted transcriptional regulator